MRIKCTNKKCEKVWAYKGKQKFYATCPDCHTNTKIVEYTDGHSGAD